MNNPTQSIVRVCAETLFAAMPSSETNGVFQQKQMRDYGSWRPGVGLDTVPALAPDLRA